MNDQIFIIKMLFNLHAKNIWISISLRWKIKTALRGSGLKLKLFDLLAIHKFEKS